MAFTGAYAGQVSLTFASTDLGGRNINLSTRIRQADTTTVADSYETFLTTLKGADVSIETPFDTADIAVDEGDKGWMVVQVAVGKYVVGTGDCIGVTYGIPIGDAVGFSGQFKYNGSFWRTP